MKKRKHVSITDTNMIVSLYKCDECPFTTAVSEDLRAHKEEHKKITPPSNKSESVFMHSCITCPLKTDDYEELRLHIDSEHRNSTTFRCKLCPYEAISEIEIDNHNTEVHVAVPKNKCKLCDFNTSEL